MLINQKKCRRYLLEEAERTRPTADFTRVSAEVLELINRHMESFLRQVVQQQPSGRGKTISEVP